MTKIDFTWKLSFISYWKQVLIDQGFYIWLECPWKELKEMTAYLNRYRIIQLIDMLCIFLLHCHVGGYGFTEVVENEPCPYFLNNKFRFFTMEINQPNGVF